MRVVTGGRILQPARLKKTQLGHGLDRGYLVRYSERLAIVLYSEQSA